MLSYSLISCYKNNIRYTNIQRGQEGRYMVHYQTNALPTDQPITQSSNRAVCLGAVFAKTAAKVRYHTLAPKTTTEHLS